MAILVYTELSKGKFKKASFEACTYAADLATAQGETLTAVVIGNPESGELNTLGRYGVSNVYHISDPALESFSIRAWMQALHIAVNTSGAQTVVMPQTYNARALAPGLSIRMQAALLSGVTSLPDQKDNAWHFTRPAFSGKGIEVVSALLPRQVITVKANGYSVKEKQAECISEPLTYTPSENDNQAIAKEIIKAGSKISLTEADIVVSGGRGLKGAENWGLVEDLANVLGAATACSKPVADVEWRPHHEHVGQTGIQIAPNLYIAIGISGAIQHLAGVNGSKVIVVINKDPEAPFFKAADFGIIGDAFEVIPRITQAIKELKNAG